MNNQTGPARLGLVPQPVEMQVVYGGQWGSEGKGRICVYLAQHRLTPWMYAIRVGGPNAGHTITDAAGWERKLQQIPVAAFASSRVIPVIGPAGMVLPEVLERELDWYDATWQAVGALPPKLRIDHLATVILPKHREAERGIVTTIASTGEGVGAATADKAMRHAMTFENWVGMQTDHTASRWLSRVMFVDSQRMLTDPEQGTQEYHLLNQGVTIQLEGTQGYMLSLNAGRFYPYCTSRDCGPEAIAAQCGLSLRTAMNTRVICVMRTYPIRVGGDSGPMGEEISWSVMSQLTNGYVTTPETTTVTGRQRRIAMWSDEIARRVGAETRPTEIALTFADYLIPDLARVYDTYGERDMLALATNDRDPKGKEDLRELHRFITGVQASTNAPVTMFSVGPAKIVARYHRHWVFSDEPTEAKVVTA